MLDSPSLQPGDTADELLLARVWDWAAAASEPIDASEVTRRATAPTPRRWRAIASGRRSVAGPVVAAVMVIALGTGALLVGLATSTGPLQSAVMVPEVSPSPRVLCPSEEARLFCPNFGNALIRLENGERRLGPGNGTTTHTDPVNGTPYAVAWSAPLVAGRSIADVEDAMFTIEYRQSDGSGLRITGHPSEGVHLREPGWSLEIDQPSLGNRFVDDGTTCAINLDTVPPRAIAGTYSCPGLPLVDGTGWVDAKGNFDAARAPGVATVGLSDSTCADGGPPDTCGPYQPYLRAMPMTSTFEPAVPGGPFRLVYEDPAWYRLEISGVATPGAHGGDPVFSVALHTGAEGGGADVFSDAGDACTVIIDLASSDEVLGSFLCRGDAVQEEWGVDTLSGTFSAAPGN